MHDALQMAMEGHARLLNQYAELQEKHTLLLAKVREIRDGVSDIKKVAKRSGMNATEARWFDVQSSQIVAMKIELDREKKAARQEIEALHVQLQDTADAVQAAGELLVRLKEAEEATSIAKVHPCHTLKHDLSLRLSNPENGSRQKCG
jgi:kinesin family protein 15